MKKLSLVIATRNDMWNSGHTTPLFRLQKSLKRTLHNAGDTNMEIIIVDYGSDEKIEDNLGIDDARLKFIYIDKEECEKYDTPFNEVKCINRGAKNSTGDFIGRLDQDTFIGKDFFNWFNNKNLLDGEFYFSARCDLGRGRYEENKNAKLWSTAGSNKFFWKAAVGILLVPKKLYFESRGYCEKNILRNHMEWEFISRLKNIATLYNLVDIIGKSFYHIWHERLNHNRTGNKPLTEQELNNLEFVVNDETWG